MQRDGGNLWGENNRKSSLAIFVFPDHPELSKPPRRSGLVRVKEGLQKGKGVRAMYQFQPIGTNASVFPCSLFFFGLPAERRVILVVCRANGLMGEKFESSATLMGQRWILGEGALNHLPGFRR